MLIKKSTPQPTTVPPHPSVLPREPERAASPPPQTVANPASQSAIAGEVTTSESRLIVGPNVKLKGAQILDCDTLVVEGRVEATMDSHVIRIAEKGVFVGTVSIDVAEIWGTFEGELTVRSQLNVHGTGKVSGKIRYGKLHIEEGGEIAGEISSLVAEQSKRSGDSFLPPGMIGSSPSGAGSLSNLSS